MTAPDTCGAMSGMTNLARVNKSEWIRSQPVEMPVHEVLRKAEEEGIQLSSAHVYTARSLAKRASAGTSPGVIPMAGRRRGRPPATSPTNSSLGSDDLQREFLRLVLRIGTEQARVLIDQIALEGV